VHFSAYVWSLIGWGLTLKPVAHGKIKLKLEIWGRANPTGNTTVDFFSYLLVLPVGEINT